MSGRKKDNIRHTISCSQLVKSRSWYRCIVDMGGICRLEVNDEGPSKDINSADKPG